MLHFTYIALALLLSLSYVRSLNLITNPSFEQCIQSTSHSKTPVGWTQLGSGLTVYCSSTRSHTGNYSAQFTPQSITNISTQNTIYESHLLQNVTINDANQELTFSYWIYLGAVPEIVTPQLNGSFTFNVLYRSSDGMSHEIVPHYVPGSCTEASNHFYQYTATFTPMYAGTLSLSFIAYEPVIYIYMDDVTLMTPLVVGDPQFVGLRGQSYQVHGIDGEVYNLITSQHTQVNSRFVFLRSGECPVLNGTRQSNCWTHPGSYLGSIGVQQSINSTIHELEIISGSALSGFRSIRLNGRLMRIGELFDDMNLFSAHLINTHRILVQTEQFSFIFDNSDMFINQQVTPRVFLSTLTSHGLFGQTHQRLIYQNRIKYIEGVVDDYRVERRDLFGKGFTFNQFEH